MHARVYVCVCARAHVCMCVCVVSVCLCTRANVRSGGNNRHMMCLFVFIEAFQLDSLGHSGKAIRNLRYRRIIEERWW